VPAPGGEQTGKDPTTRGKLGTKRHDVVDRNGVPVGVTISRANVHDSQLLEENVDAILPLRLPHRQEGRPRKRPTNTKQYADKGYDYLRCRQALRTRGIIPRLVRRSIEPSERLGRYRWVGSPAASTLRTSLPPLRRWAAKISRLLLLSLTARRPWPCYPHLQSTEQGEGSG
jgi:hypothetical protein